MITLSQVTELLGWASVINIGFLLFSTVILVSAKSTIMTMHSKIFGVSENELSIIYFKYLANYKVLTLVFIVSPYFSLKIMGQ